VSTATSIVTATARQLETGCTVQAGSERSKASLPVICALLHLFGLPSFANTVLSQCYNPIVSVVESSLDMHKVCQCVTDLSKQGSITDSKSKTVSLLSQHIYHLAGFQSCSMLCMYWITVMPQLLDSH